VHDQDVAVGAAGDSLADAAAEQSLEEAGLARPDHDHVGVSPFRGVDNLLDRFADDAGELVRYTDLGEERLDPFPVLLPELRIASCALLSRIDVIGASPKR
jgi:hypothetical protein